LKILVLSSLYPPYYVGGYELGCRDVVEELQRRGRTIKVLTSTYGVGRATSDGKIYRWLESDLGWKFESSTSNRLKLAAKELRNRRAFSRLVSEFQPDLLYIWPIRYISLSLALMAQRIGLPVCYYVSDDWLARWESIDRWMQLPRHPLTRLSKRLLGIAVEALGGRTAKQTLDLRHVQFTSEHIKRAALAAGKLVERADVIHWGVDTVRFPYRSAVRPEVRRFLYVGQLALLKGVHTAIDAFRQIVAARGDHDLTLTIAGGTIFPEYAAELHRLVRSAGLEQRVRFSGLLARDELPALYQEHDALIFPSIWDEPFSITLIEALASGLPVVGTTTGGSAEILRHGENALTFPKEDAGACAAELLRLIDQPELGERLRWNGRRTIEARFRFETMIDSIDNALHAACGVRPDIRV
jgi:glycosyltransferase involved in cell wall biosynthesis